MFFKIYGRQLRQPNEFIIQYGSGISLFAGLFIGALLVLIFLQPVKKIDRKIRSFAIGSSSSDSIRNRI